VITYYQRRRHIFGDMKLEVYERERQTVGTMPTSKRRGLNRASWSMRLRAARAAGASAAFGAAFGPRVLPGTYTIKLTKDTATFTSSSSSSRIPGPPTHKRSDSRRSTWH